jgi:hypothetical protein
MVGPDLLGELERGLGGVDDDDLRRRECLEALDCNVAESPGADDHSLGSGVEKRRRLLDGVIRGQPRVGVRGDVLGLEAPVSLMRLRAAAVSDVCSPFPVPE